MINRIQICLLLSTLFITISRLKSCSGPKKTEHPILKAIQQNINYNRQNNDLPICSEGSACNLLKTVTMGFTVHKFCSCPGGNSCPTKWHFQPTYESDSIRIDHIDYKFCSAVSSSQKEYCRSSDIALEVNGAVSSIDRKNLLHDTFVHCRCYHNQRYKSIYDKGRKIESDNDMLKVTNKMKCETMDTCGKDDPCRKIEIADNEIYINRLCACIGQEQCPTDATLAFKEETTYFGRIYYLKCGPSEYKRVG